MLEILTSKTFAGCVKAGVKRPFYGLRVGLVMWENQCLSTSILRISDLIILAKRIISTKEWFLLASWTIFLR